MLNSDIPGCFLDASFLLYDTETPLLISVTAGETVTFNFAFDGINVIPFVFNQSACVPDASIQLRYGGRYYGNLVFGPSIYTLVSGALGLYVGINTEFHGNTVRTLNSKGGVYSFGGLYGPVNVTTDNDLMMNVTGAPTPNLSAISLPNALQTVQSDSNSLYIWQPVNQDMTILGVSSLQTVLNPNQVIGSFVVSSNVPRLDFVTSAVHSGSQILIGAANTGDSTSIFDCSTYPWYKISEIASTNAVQLSYLNDHIILLDVSGNLIDLGLYPYNDPQTITTGVSGLINMASVNGSGGGYLVMVARGGVGYSDHYYQINLTYSLGGVPSAVVTPKGLFAYNGNSSMLGTHTITTIQSGGVNKILVNSGAQLYTIPATSSSVYPGVASAYGSSLGSAPTVTTYIVQGGWSVTYKPVTPLKLINNGTGTGNISILGSELVTVKATKPNEITISIDVDDSRTNIKRTQHYAAI